ncbi:hypothetical protein [Streptomyces sp. NPDC020141]|uniref:hypothetical protein n=1 Tax=Streptomyces sp. NPDC020141 TaxID=3365065 RepID=UPI00378A1F8F
MRGPAVRHRAITAPAHARDGARAVARGIRPTAAGGGYDPLHSSFPGGRAGRALRAPASAEPAGFAYHQEQHIVSVRRAGSDPADRSAPPPCPGGAIRALAEHHVPPQVCAAAGP